MCWAGAFPSLQRRGGCGINKKSAKPTERRRRGGRSHTMFRTHSEMGLVSDHPVRAFSNGIIFLMARPPLLCKEGNVLSQPWFLDQGSQLETELLTQDTRDQRCRKIPPV